VDLQLENKVVLVTGGAKRIGAAIVRAAAAEAAVPVIVDRDARGLQESSRRGTHQPRDHRGSFPRRIAKLRSLRRLRSLAALMLS